MDDEESLTMKLLSKLEDLSSENSRLRSVETVLENKVVEQSRALEIVEEELRESVLRESRSGEMGEEGEVHVQGVESTPVLLERAVPMGGMTVRGMGEGENEDDVQHSAGWKGGRKSSMLPSRRQTPHHSVSLDDDIISGNGGGGTPASLNLNNTLNNFTLSVNDAHDAHDDANDNAHSALNSSIKPWESGGIRNQILSFGDRLEELELENESLKKRNEELKRNQLNAGQQQGGETNHNTGGIGLSNSDKKVVEVQNDMRILLAHQRTLMSTFEQKAFALGKSERNLETFKKMHEAELNRMSVKVDGLMDALVVAKSGVEEEKLKRFKVLEELEWFKRREESLVREVERKNEAIKAMRVHAGKIGEQYKRSVMDRRGEGDR